MPTESDFQDRLKSIERLLSDIEEEANPNLCTSVKGLVQLVMDLHGAGLARMLEVIGVAPDGGEKMVQKLGRDELVSSLLILHGLHPMSLDARLTQALDKVRLKLRAHESELEILSVQNGAVHLRLQANGHGCGSTGPALKEIVENAVYQYAPDLTSLVIDGVEDEGDAKQGFVPLEMLLKSASPGEFALAANEKGGA